MNIWREVIYKDLLPPDKEKLLSSVSSTAGATLLLIVIMSLAINDTSPQSIFVSPKVVKNAQTPPPETVSAALAKGKDSKISSNFRVGDSVVIFSLRENRTKYNGEIGQVCAVIWPNDRERSIIYVKTGKMQPCFSESELKKAPAPQAVEEVEA